MPTTPKRLFFVVCKNLPGVTIYDADTQERVSQPITPGTINPHEGAFSRDGRVVYVPIYGTSGVGKPGLNGHLLYAFGSLDGTQIGALDTGIYRRPHCIAVGQRTGFLYLTAELAESVIVVDPQTLAIVAATPTQSNTSHFLALTRDERFAYVSNVRSQTISVLDLEAQKLVKTIETEGENQRMALSPDERWFVTSLGPAGKIAFYRTSDWQLDFAISVGGTPFVAKFSANGKSLYNAGFASPGKMAAWKIDVDKRGVTGYLDADLGEDPGSLEVNPFNGSVYISDQPTDKINLIDPDTWTLSGVIATEKTPDAMGFATLTELRPRGNGH